MLDGQEESLMPGYSTTVRCSSMHDALESASLVVNLLMLMVRVIVRVIILGNAAYSLLPFLLKPCLTTDDRLKNMSNFMSSSTTIVVERAFGLLKERFRIPNKQEDTSLNHIRNVRSTCCVPYNFCLFHGAEADDDWMMTTAVGLGVTSQVSPFLAGGKRYGWPVRDSAFHVPHSTFRFYHVFVHVTNSRF